MNLKKKRSNVPLMNWRFSSERRLLHLQLLLRLLLHDRAALHRCGQLLRASLGALREYFRGLLQYITIKIFNLMIKTLKCKILWRNANFDRGHNFPEIIWIRCSKNGYGRNCAIGAHTRGQTGYLQPTTIAAGWLLRIENNGQRLQSRN